MDDTHEGVDQEARRVVYGERAQTYGHPRGDFAAIAGIWMAMVRARAEFIAPGVKVEDVPWEKVLDEELVAIMMSGLKLARLTKSPKHRDSQVDTIGYILCLTRLQDDPVELAAWNEREEPKVIDQADLNTAQIGLVLKD